MDAIGWRGLERIIIVVGSIVFGCLGYKLYRFGINEGQNKVQFKSTLFNLAVAGVGPGITFIALSASIMFIALFKGGARCSENSSDGSLAQRFSSDIEQYYAIEKYNSDFTNLTSVANKVRPLEDTKKDDVTKQ